MRLHPRAAIVREAKAKFALELFRSEALGSLTLVEKAMVMNSVLSEEIAHYIKYDLRVERHGCQHIKADQFHEGICQECEDEIDGPES